MTQPTRVVLRSTVLHRGAAWVLHPVVILLQHFRIDPNWVTGFSVVFALGVGKALWDGSWWTAALFLAANGICDVVDGELARSLDALGSRKMHLKQMGYILDGLTDRVADLFIFAGLIMRTVRMYPADTLEERTLIFGLVIALGSHIISSYLRATLEKHGHTLRKQQRPLTRAGFHVAVATVCLCTRYVQYDELEVFYWTNLSTVCALTVFVLVKRMIEAYGIFSAMDRTPDK
ncbi:MAG: CDP-alcohol phosphatidyltransferase family protein [Parcubacteria group bacterium]